MRAYDNLEMREKFNLIVRQSKELGADFRDVDENLQQLLFDSGIVKFFQVGFRIEFNLDVTRKSGGEFLVDYIEDHSFEPNNAITRKKQKEHLDLF